MKEKLRIWSIKLELLGLVILLVGSFWQAKLSGWWDQQLPEWQYLIQEEVNLSVLYSLKDLAFTSTTDDEKLRSIGLENIRERTVQTTNRIIDQRDQRKAAMDGQASTFWTIRDCLILGGAFLLMLGKWISLKSESCKEDSR